MRPDTVASPGVSIVIVTWNCAPELANALESIARHGPRGAEVIVVDSASTDESVDVARRWPGGAEVHALSENVGFGRANNLGVERARHDVVVLLNPDTLLIDDALSQLADLVSREDVLCGPRILNADGSVQVSAGAVPGGWEMVAAGLAPSSVFRGRLRDRVTPWRAEARTRVGWLIGACVVGRRTTLRELGPFDPAIHMYGEDIDLGIRAARRGTPSVFAPDLGEIVHLGGVSASRRFDDRGAARIAAGRRAVVRRHFGRRRELVDTGGQALGFAVRAATKPLVRRDASFDRAMLKALVRGGARPIA